MVVFFRFDAMTYKINLTSLLILLLITNSFAGVFRHDVQVVLHEQLAAQPQFDCVGGICNDTSAAPMGSCVLISERFVLTAAHVFMHNKKVAPAKNIVIVLKGRQIKAKQIIVYKPYLEKFENNSFDIALVELEEPVRGVHIPALNTQLDEMKSIVTGVGYGVTGFANKPEDIKATEKPLAGQNTIDGFGGEKINGVEALMLADMDYPQHPEYNLMGDAEPIQLEYALGGGDSGGPLFRERNGKWELMGIAKGTSFVVERFTAVGYYGQMCKWVRVAVFADWIKQHAKLK